jgi:exonuclease VII large subunit
MKHVLNLTVAGIALVMLAGCGGSSPVDKLSEMTELMQSMTETLRPIETAANAEDAADKLKSQAAKLETLSQALEQQMADMDEEAKKAFNDSMEQSEFPSVAMAFMMELMRVGMIPGASEKLGDVLETLESAPGL